MVNSLCLVRLYPAVTSAADRSPSAEEKDKHADLPGDSTGSSNIEAFESMAHSNMSPHAQQFLRYASPVKLDIANHI
eukprot:1682497-Amphidinium_carterae.1